MLCVQVVVQKRLRCVCRWVCRGGRGGCAGVCIHTCLTSENMSPGGDTGLNFADCPLSFKVAGH